MATVSSAINLNITSNQSLDLDLGSVTYNPVLSLKTSLANGTGDNEANQVFADTRSLAAATAEELDLSGGLTDAFGNSVAFTAIKSIMIKADSANAGDIQVGGAAANAFNTWCGDAADIVNIQAGGAFVIVAPNAGFAVTAATADLLKINNLSAGASSYSISLTGTE